MTTPSLYIVGGAGVGKSTFTQELLTRLGGAFDPLLDLHRTPNARGTMITLRGHVVKNAPRYEPGLYLGVMRESFPGSDGLDRVSGLPGEEWLESGGAESFSFILGEGATLATRRFVSALHRRTDLLLLHLYCDEMIKELRLYARGSNQAPSFIQGTATRALNLTRDMEELGVYAQGCETSDDESWELALRIAENHLLKNFFSI